jgi:hypothetical protein
MAFVDAVANALLDSVLGSSTLIGTPVYVGLLLSAPNADGTGVDEVSGFDYVRQAVTNDVSNWPAAASRTKTHSGDIVFPDANGGDWGLVTHVGIFTALSGGTLKLAGALTISRQVNDGDILRFLAASNPLTLTLPFVLA